MEEATCNSDNGLQLYFHYSIESQKYYHIAIVTTFRISLCLLSFISECVTNEQMHMRQRNLNQGGKYNS